MTQKQKQQHKNKNFTVTISNLVPTEVYSLILVPMDTEAQALIQILKSLLDH